MNHRFVIKKVEILISYDDTCLFIVTLYQVSEQKFIFYWLHFIALLILFVSVKGNNTLKENLNIHKKCEYRNFQSPSIKNSVSWR